MRYTKKPVTIEAVRFIGLTDFGDPQFDVADGMPDWLMEALAGPEGDAGSVWAQGITNGHDTHRWLTIGTLEGQHTASPGDWIIQGIKGELYPCKPDIFEASYDGLFGPKGAQAEIAPEIVQVAKEARRSLLLDMQSECIQLRVALAKARDYFQYEQPAMAAMCQKAIDCRPATIQPIDDESLRAMIGELGNQISNLGCDYQRNEVLSRRLEELRAEAWRLAALASPVAVSNPESHKLETSDGKGDADDYAFVIGEGFKTR